MVSDLSNVFVTEKYNMFISIFRIWNGLMFIYEILPFVKQVNIIPHADKGFPVRERTWRQICRRQKKKIFVCQQTDWKSYLQKKELSPQQSKFCSVDLRRNRSVAVPWRKDVYIFDS